MATNIKTGHSKNITNFETLITICQGYGKEYNPSIEDIYISNLMAQYEEAKEILKNVKTTEAPFNDAEGQRKLLFEPLKSTATKIINALKGAKAPATVITDAETINRKIQGRRANTVIEKTTEGDMPKEKKSVSQQSHDMLIDHFEKMIALISLEPKYKPNEEHLKIETLSAYKNQLETINKAVKTSYIAYSDAMQKRNEKLYNPETGLVETAKTVKNYVKSVYGATHPKYKQLSKLSFRFLK